VTPPAPARGPRRALSDLFHERTNYNFIDRSWRWALLSGTVLLIAIGGLAIRGLNLGIDFTGGLSYTVSVKGPAPSVNTVRDVLRNVGQADAKISIQQNVANGTNSVVVQAPTVSAATRDRIRGALQRYGPVTNAVEVSATWGDTVTNKALVALIVFFFLIAGYLTLRFEWRMALAAIIAVIHDILVTTGVYAVTGFQVVPATVIAFLTILGYSLYDTVVVFDKVSENTPAVGTERFPNYSTMVNRSLNQVLMRSINTSLVAVIPVASLVFVGSGLFGATTLKDFALALFVGLTTGAYSSIFVATPIVAWLKEREPRYRAVRQRSSVQQTRRTRDVPAPAVVGAPSTDRAEEAARPGPPPEPAVPSVSSAPSPRPGAVAPRPRQQRRRKRR
jgi:preprotein translocase subunit SecF